MKKRRFTLIELICAMAILALIGGVIGSALAVMMNSYNKSQKAEKELERNLAIDRMVNTLFSGAVPFQWPDTENSVNTLVFSGEPDELWITALRPVTGNSGGALVFARIYLSEGNLCADTNTRPLLPWKEIDTQDFTTEIIADNVEALLFRYAMIDPDDPDKILWYEDWEESIDTTESTEPEELPAAISMTLTFSDGSELSWLRRTAGTSAVTIYSAFQEENREGASR